MGLKLYDQALVEKITSFIGNFVQEQRPVQPEPKDGLYEEIYRVFTQQTKSSEQ